jgi:hypothetical protein
VSAGRRKLLSLTRTNYGFLLRLSMASVAPKGSFFALKIRVIEFLFKKNDVLFLNDSFFLSGLRNVRFILRT